MDESLTQRFARIRAELADRPFGDVGSVSGRALQSFSNASMAAADNLLAKAALALRTGDADRAGALVERAAQIPFDDHEESIPAAWSVHMMLYSLVADAVEDTDADDLTWLVAAERVLTGVGEHARYAMRDVLAEIDRNYRLESRERKRLRAAVLPIPARTRLEDLRVPPADFAEQVMEVLSACEMYLAALDG